MTTDNVLMTALRASDPSRKPTIYEALKAKLRREPTHAELCADVSRILREGAEEGRRARR